MAILAAIFETVKFVVVQFSSYKFVDLKGRKKSFPWRRIESCIIFYARRFTQMTVLDRR